MICKKCGYDNFDDETECAKCGAPLENERQTEALDDDFDDVKYYEKQDFDDEPYYPEQENAQADTKNTYTLRPTTRIRDKINVAIIVLSVMFVGVFIFTISLIKREFFPSENTETTNSVSELNLPEPEIKIVSENSSEHVHAVFYGEPGDKLYLACNESLTVFSENTIEMDLYLEDLFPADYQFLEEIVNANIRADHIRNGKHYAYNINGFKLSVPEADFELSSPKAQNDKSYSDTYLLKFWVDTSSTVLVNGEDVSKKADAMGNIELEVSTPEDSSETYYIEVSQPYRLPKKQTLFLMRDKSKVDLDITNASVSGNTCTITFTMQADARITANLPICEEVKHNDLYNNYTVKLDLTDATYGPTEAILTAEIPSGKTNKSVRFMYWPEESEITVNCDALTLSATKNLQKGAQYVLREAKVIRPIGADTFEASCNIDGEEFAFSVKYINKQTNIIAGNSYKMFLAATGTKNKSGLPQFKAWFIY